MAPSRPYPLLTCSNSISLNGAVFSVRFGEIKRIIWTGYTCVDRSIAYRWQSLNQRASWGPVRVKQEYNYVPMAPGNIASHAKHCSIITLEITKNKPSNMQAPRAAAKQYCAE